MLPIVPIAEFVATSLENPELRKRFEKGKTIAAVPKAIPEQYYVLTAVFYTMYMYLVMLLKIKMTLAIQSLPFLHLFLALVLGAFTIGFLLRIVLTWYPKINLNKGLWPFISWPTEPFLKFTRKFIGPIGGVDITPVIWVGLITLTRELLVGQQGLLTQLLNKTQYLT